MPHSSPTDWIAGGSVAADIVGCLTGLVADLSWQDEAACRGLPTEWWFPQQGSSHECQRAKAISRSCPVKAQCLQFAIEVHDQHGIYAGLSLRDRRKWGNERKAS
ncbi:Putative transcriptional regulator, WhiB family [Mycobacteroides abscessus subsp. massiliense]|uniref:WhiB family transcriptional regulator n=1 Tax=Mycobacteroides abscessus TaxID=36809 RepID=UPI0009A69DCC|nr:Putative transcriptional regulator, WhiB family [Mycobacteroides abscessus subsp. massiliense]SLI18414.1 Putative transcriptional regulator, WhiB family [Mycobacteroides abscessus subsp. massiliense]